MSQLSGRVYWFPMWDPEYYTYDTEVQYCPHITFKFAKGWDPEKEDTEWVKCYDPYCERSDVAIFNE
jgi:hypothetical protein